MMLNKKLYVPSQISDLKVSPTEAGQLFEVAGPWGSTSLSIQHPFDLSISTDLSGSRILLRSTIDLAVSKINQADRPCKQDINPLETSQNPLSFIRQKDLNRSVRQMSGLLVSLIENGMRACSIGSHYGVFIDGLGWRAVVRTGKEVPGGEMIPMLVEKPGKARVIPTLPPGLKVDGGDRFIELKIGNSHYTHIKIPEGWKVLVDDHKSQNLIISAGVEKGVVGLFADRIRSSRTSEPYKGKGIRLTGQEILRKEGKKSQ
jgi:ribosomal protein L6P/L9E